MDIKTKLDKYFDSAQRAGKSAPTQVLVWSGSNKLEYKFPGQNSSRRSQNNSSPYLKGEL